MKLEKDCLGDGLSIYESKTEKAKRILGSIGGGVARGIGQRVAPSPELRAEREKQYLAQLNQQRELLKRESDIARYQSQMRMYRNRQQPRAQPPQPIIGNVMGGLFGAAPQQPYAQRPYAVTGDRFNNYRATVAFKARGEKTYANKIIGNTIYSSKQEASAAAARYARQQKMQEPLLQFKAGTKRV